MKSFLKAIVVPVLSAVIGGLIVFVTLEVSPQMRSKIGHYGAKKLTADSIYDDIIKKNDGIRNQFDSIFNDDFFGQKDPFEDLKKMREQMERRMEPMAGRSAPLSNPFDSWFSDKFGGGTIDDISKREDDGYVYYDIKVDDVKSTTINTKVENGYVAISGTLEKKTSSTDDQEKGPSQSIYKSTFNRTFPLPEHVDQNKMQVTTEKDKIVLKFPKMKV